MSRSAMYFDDLLKDERLCPFPQSEKTCLFSLPFRDCLFEIRTNSEKIAGAVKSVYGSLISNRTDRSLAELVTYCHFEENGRYIITRNDRFAYSCESLPQAVSRLDWMLMSDIVDHNSHIPVIHASAVAKDGNSLMFIGKSGSGKSSLAMLMSLEGWEFISDDIVMVDSAIIGVSRAPCLAENLAEKYIKTDVGMTKGYKRGQGYVYIDPRSINIKTASHSFSSVTHAIFLESCEAGHKLERLGEGAVLKMIIENLFDTSRYFERKLDVLIEIAGGLSGAFLKWSDIHMALRDVKSFISSS